MSSRRFRSRMARAVVCPVAALCLLAGCSGDETSGKTASGDEASGPETSAEETPGDADSATPPRLVDGPLAPGAYQLSFLVDPGVEAPDAVVEVPSGFDGSPPWYVVSHDTYQFLGLWTVGQVDRDACPPGKNHLFDPGPSVEDLADALVAQKSTRASAPEPVTLAGYQGRYVELASPRDISSCKLTGHLWGEPGGRGIYNAGQVDLMWILDVDGQRLVVNAAYSRPKSTASDIDKLTSMVESLEFVPAVRE
jgi:hypothetical protein